MSNKEELETRKEINKSLEEQKQKTEEIEKTSLKINSSMKMFRDNFAGFKQDFKRVTDIWVSLNFLNNMQDVLKTMIKTNSELHRAAINAGKSGQELENIKKQVVGLQTSLGATQTEAISVVKTLTESQYVGNLEKAAQATFMMHKATTLSETEVAKLTTQLSREGQMGDDAITAMYADMLKVQQANGISVQGMSTLTSNIGAAAEKMRIFGKSDTAIRQMAISTSKFVSEMEKVGVAADKALEIVNRLLDPEKVTENISAYAALGVSISDAISGNISVDQVDAGLKEFGQKLKEMGPIAGKAYADAMKIEYSTAIKAASAESIEVEMTPEQEATKQMQELMTATMSTTEKIQASINKISGTIQSAGPVLLTIIYAAYLAFNRFVKKSGKDITEETVKQSKTIKELVGGALESAGKKFGIDVDGIKQKRALKKENKKMDVGKTAFGRERAANYQKELEEKSKQLGERLVKESAAHEEFAKKMKEQQKELNKQKNLIKNSNISDESKNQLTKKINEEQKKLKQAIQDSYNALDNMAKESLNVEKQAKDLKIALDQAKPPKFQKTKKVAGAVKTGVGAAKNAVGGVLSKVAGPLAIASAGIGMIVGFLSKNQKIAETLQGFMSKVGATVSKMLEKIMPAMDSLVNALEPVVASILEALEPFIEAVGAVMQALGPILQVLKPFLVVIMKVVGVLVKPITWMANIVGKLFEWVHKMASGIAKLFHINMEQKKLQEDENNSLDGIENNTGRSKETLSVASSGRIASSGGSVEGSAATSTNSATQSGGKRTEVANNSVSDSIASAARSSTNEITSKLSELIEQTRVSNMTNKKVEEALVAILSASSRSNGSAKNYLL